MGIIKTRNDLIGLNAFSKMFGLTRLEVERIVSRGQVNGIRIKDGSVDRVFINLADILEEARQEGIKPSELVRRFCRQSKRH